MGKTAAELKDKIRVIPNFPKKGIMFQDIFSLTEDSKTFENIIRKISFLAKKNKITKVAGIEARGFIFASAVALKNKIAFVPIRKKGKLPGRVYKEKYKLEYGYDEIEMQKNSILKKDRVLILDDLIATGGTAIASAKLLKRFKPKHIQFFFVIDLYNLHGSERLKKLNYKVTSLIETLG